MNILQINSIDSRGGAAKLASRLGHGLTKKGHSVNELVGHKIGLATNTEEIKYSESTRDRNRKLKLRGTFLPTANTVNSHDYFKRADLVQLHNLHLEPEGFFNIRALPNLSRKPTVWTLHDPWLVYDAGKTPQYDYFFADIPAWFHRAKNRAVKRSNLVIVTPSKWLGGLVKEVFPEKEIRVIPNGVDTSIFKPIDKKRARAGLSIDANSKVVLFVANGGEDNLPKVSQFVDGARQAFPDLQFISLGSSKPGGYIDSEAQMAKYYSAADLLLLPSLAENLPLTVLEAMACGTPAVAFDTGGISEAITHLKNGYVAKYADQADLIDGVKSVIKNGKAMGNSAAREATERFSLSKMTDSYIELYSSII